MVKSGHIVALQAEMQLKFSESFFDVNFEEKEMQLNFVFV